MSPVFYADLCAPRRPFRVALLMLISAAAIAGSDGLLELPEHYRTPLADDLRGAGHLAGCSGGR